MYNSLTRSAGGFASVKGMFTGDGFTGDGPPRDDESPLAPTLQTTRGDSDAKPAVKNRTASPGKTPERKTADARRREVAAEIARTLEARLPGRIRELRVEIQEDQFTLYGVSTTYYVKQVAGHLAMRTMDARLLGRLLNEIEVHSLR